MLTKIQQMLTKIQQMLTKNQHMLQVDEKDIFLVVWQYPNVFQMQTFVNMAKLLFTAIFSKENIGKNGQKSEKCQNFKKKTFSSIHKIWWHE